MTQENKGAPTGADGACLGCLGIGVVLVIVLVVFGALSGGGSSPSTSAASAPDKIEAWIMAEKFVKDRLKSPGTANFGGVFNNYQDPDDQVSVVGANTYVVTGWVDAQNGFGATVRTNWRCKLLYLGNGKWRCLDLTMEQR